MTQTRYTTTHLATGEAIEVPSHAASAKRSGVTYITWAKFNDGWALVGASKATDYAKACKSAKSVAPYALDWDATPAVDTLAPAEAPEPRSIAHNANARTGVYLGELRDV